MTMKLGWSWSCFGYFLPCSFLALVKAGLTVGQRRRATMERRVLFDFTIACVQLVRIPSLLLKTVPLLTANLR